jgi:arylsulfatase A-like enzyme
MEASEEPNGVFTKEVFVCLLWSDGLEKSKGETVQSGLFGMNDVMATLADVLGYEIEGHAKDSQNQWPVILGKQNQVRSVIAMQSSGQDYALRSGQWKYVWKMNSDTRELYNLR